MGLSEIISLSKPTAQSVEDFRRLKINIQQSSNEIKLIMIASANSGEGRTTVASNLAVQMAQSGKKTILIDFDVRDPEIHDLFKLSNEKGVLNFLSGSKHIEEIVQMTNQENLYVMASGTTLYNSGELINSPRVKDLFKLISEDFDYVIIDTAPLVKLADAQIISPYVDACVLVVGIGQGSRETIITAKEALENAKANVLGVVLNKVLDRKKI